MSNEKESNGDRIERIINGDLNSPEYKQLVNDIANEIVKRLTGSSQWIEYLNEDYEVS